MKLDVRDFAAKVRFVFKYPAVIDEWHDGDTCYVHRVAWPGLVISGEHVRVQGINAPELGRTGGLSARDYAAYICPPGTQVTLVSTEADKYGRFLARITLPDGSDFSQRMIEAGHAVSYME
jgi:micrococcal nuclease